MPIESVFGLASRHRIPPARRIDRTRSRYLARAARRSTDDSRDAARRARVRGSLSRVDRLRLRVRRRADHCGQSRVARAIRIARGVARGVLAGAVGARRTLSPGGPVRVRAAVERERRRAVALSPVCGGDVRGVRGGGARRARPRAARARRDARRAPFRGAPAARGSGGERRGIGRDGRRAREHRVRAGDHARFPRRARRAGRRFLGARRRLARGDRERRALRRGARREGVGSDGPGDRCALRVGVASAGRRGRALGTERDLARLACVERLRDRARDHDRRAPRRARRILASLHRARRGARGRDDHPALVDDDRGVAARIAFCCSRRRGSRCTTGRRRSFRTAVRA